MSYLLIYYSEDELACKHCGQRGCTDELKRGLDDFRKLVSLPVRVHDAFRCKVHNSAVSLVSKSQHPAGTAADISVLGMTLQELYDSAKRIPAFDYGGIGAYQGGFIHVDVRDTGSPARWAFVGNKQLPITALVKE